MSEAIKMETSNVAGGGKTALPITTEAIRRTIIQGLPRYMAVKIMLSTRKTMPLIKPAHTAALQSTTCLILAAVWLMRTSYVVSPIINFRKLKEIKVGNVLVHLLLMWNLSFFGESK
jgi:hypothetical protein